MSLLHPGLEAFIAIVQETTVYGAAGKIGLSQTGVTQRIRSLERALGTTLFTRSRKGMRPTSEGESLYRYCQRVMDLEGELLSTLRQSDTAQFNVHMSGPSSIMRSRIIPQVTAILSSFNNLTFTFNLDDDKSCLNYLKSGLSQLAIIQRHEAVNELDTKLLEPASFILVAARNWRERHLADILRTERIIDFNSTDDATFQYLKKFGLFDTAQKQRHLANNIDALAMMVAKGHGYSVLIEEFAQPFIDDGTLTDINPQCTMRQDFALAWYPRHEMPRYFDMIIGAIN